MARSRKFVRRHELRSVRHNVKVAHCSNAALILMRTRGSSDALLEAFEMSQSARSAGGGMTTDAEQDLLRAMLVMAAAGLDSMLKRLIRDSMPTLVSKNTAVREGLEKFVARSVRGDADGTELAAGAKFLGRILAAESQQTQVIEEYIRELTGSSLQSATELMKTTAALGLSGVSVDAKLYKEIFDVRNKIIHELDINLDSAKRKRTIRGKESMMQYANSLLEIGESILFAVDGQLRT